MRVLVMLVVGWVEEEKGEDEEEGGREGES